MQCNDNLISFHTHPNLSKRFSSSFPLQPIFKLDFNQAQQKIQVQSLNSIWLTSTMATSLMSQPGDGSSEDAEFLVSFVVTSLEMTDEAEDDGFSEVLVVIAWDGHVAKLENKEDAEEFNESMDLLLHTTPEDFSRKLKSSPIMVNISRGCEELGTVKLPITDCFADAVLCDDFYMQTVSHEFQFINGEDENAKMSAYFRVHKLMNDDVVYQQSRSKKPKQKKKKSKKAKKGGVGRDDSDSDDQDDESGSAGNNESFDTFACPDELPEHCKRDLGLDEDLFRIINGNLFNIKEKTGPCVEKCLVAKKYIKELCKSPSETIPLSTRFQFQTPKTTCGELFDCTCDKQKKSECQDCGGQVESQQSPCVEKSFRKPSKDDWIDRNIREEDLLKKLCDKYGINVDEIKSIGQKMEAKTAEKNGKKKKLKKNKKSKKVKEVAEDLER